MQRFVVIFAHFSVHRAFPGSSLVRKSLYYKKIMMVTNFSSILGAIYCYWRHNAYCEPGMYSVFSFFEYSVVLSNMAFHFTSYFDFYYTLITLGKGFQSSLGPNTELRG